MKFRRAPVVKTADDFITGAMTSVQAEPPATTPSDRAAPSALASTPVAATESKATSSLPWEGKRSDKQTELFNLRLTEVELEKLRFIAAQTPDSMQAFIRKALLPAIEAKISEITS